MVRTQPGIRRGRGRTRRRQTARSSSSWFSQNPSAVNNTKGPSSKDESSNAVECPDLTPNDIVQPAASGNTWLSELKSASSADTQPSKRRRHSTTPPSSEQDSHQNLTPRPHLPVAAGGIPKASSYLSPIIVDTGDDEPLNHNTIVLGAREKIAAIIKALVAKLEEKPDIKSKRSFAEVHCDSAESISELLESASCECRRYKRMAQGFKSE